MAIIARYLHNAATCAVSLDLPMLDGGVLTVESRETPQPKYAGAEVGLRRSMVEEDRRFAAELSRVEMVPMSRNTSTSLGAGWPVMNDPERDEAGEVASG